MAPVLGAGPHIHDRFYDARAQSATLRYVWNDQTRDWDGGYVYPPCHLCGTEGHTHMNFWGSGTFYCRTCKRFTWTSTHGYVSRYAWLEALRCAWHNVMN